MTQYVVIGTAPTVDVSMVAGPFRTLERAAEADEVLTQKGYNTEVCECLRADEIGAADWSDGE